MDWIQIGESHWEVVRESREGFSQHLECQPQGVFRINPTPGS